MSQKVCPLSLFAVVMGFAMVLTGCSLMGGNSTKSGPLPEQATTVGLQGAEDKLEGAQDADAIMMFEAAHKQREPSATLNAQAGLIATRMRSARAILGKAISRRIVPSDAVNTGI